MEQQGLFDTSSLPPGLEYRPDFLDAAEEAQLLAIFNRLPFAAARYQQYTARRRTINYGAGYDFTARRATPAAALPDFLDIVRGRAADWVGVQPGDFVQALIAEYQPGTPLGWHRDVPDYEIVVGISLGTAARMRFRPYPWRIERKRDIFALVLEPRSGYVLRDAARWNWQHSVPPVKTLRYSITLRTANRR